VNQLGFASSVTVQEIAREKTLGGSIGLCIKAAGYEPKEVITELKMDKAQWSRWESGQEGILWPKLIAVMDYCGNDAPLLWMNRDRGYDLSSIRRQETEIERENRELKEQLAAERHDREIERQALRKLWVPAA
jgi:hypothetical protein